MAEENLDLNAVASEAMGESEPQVETQESPEVSETPKETKVENTETPKETVQNSEQKLSRRQQAAKEASEYRIKAEKELQETKSKLAAYEREIEPLKPYFSEIQKAMEAQKQAELDKLYQQNPQVANQQLMQQMIQQAIAPYQQQAEMAQRTQFTNESISQIKAFCGSEENYKTLMPYMKQILDSTRQADPTKADMYARSPEILARLARDFYNEEIGQKQNQQNQQQQVENQKSKSEMAKFNGGVSKPNRFAKPAASPTRETARQNAFDFIKELTGQNK